MKPAAADKPHRRRRLRSSCGPVLHDGEVQTGEHARSRTGTVQAPHARDRALFCAVRSSRARKRVSKGRPGRNRDLSLGAVTIIVIANLVGAVGSVAGLDGDLFEGHLHPECAVQVLPSKWAVGRYGSHAHQQIFGYRGWGTGASGADRTSGSRGNLGGERGLSATRG